MNHLREKRGRRKQSDIAKLINIDSPMISKFENGVCNPTVEQMSEICKVFDSDVFELYDKADLDYRKLSRKIALQNEKGEGDKQHVKMTIRLTKGFANKIKAQMDALNLKTQAQYIEFCILEVDKHIKKQNSPLTAIKKAVNEKIFQQQNIT